MSEELKMPEAFHPSASHIDPDYRDGYNRCHAEFTAALAASGVAAPAFEPSWHQTRIDFANATLRRMRELAPNMATVGALYPEVYREMVDKFHAAIATPSKPVAADAPAEVATCGHPVSMMLRSAESGEPLYCEACDDKSGRRDAEQMEAELRKELAANEALHIQAIEELMQLGYTVKDGQLYPPDAARLASPSASDATVTDVAEPSTHAIAQHVEAQPAVRAFLKRQSWGGDGDLIYIIKPGIDMGIFLREVIDATRAALRPTPSNERG